MLGGGRRIFEKPTFAPSSVGSYCGWTKFWVFTGESTFQDFLGGAKWISSIHSRTERSSETLVFGASALRLGPGRWPGSPPPPQAQSPPAPRGPGRSGDRARERPLLKTTPVFCWWTGRSAATPWFKTAKNGSEPGRRKGLAE